MQKVLISHLKGERKKDALLQPPGLDAYLNEGWQVVAVTAAGAGEEDYRSFIVVFVLEKI